VLASYAVLPTAAGGSRRTVACAGGRLAA